MPSVSISSAPNITAPVNKKPRRSKFFIFMLFSGCYIPSPRRFLSSYIISLIVFFYIRCKGSAFFAYMQIKSAVCCKICIFCKLGCCYLLRILVVFYGHVMVSLDLRFTNGSLTAHFRSTFGRPSGDLRATFGNRRIRTKESHTQFQTTWDQFKLEMINNTDIVICSGIENCFSNNRAL